MPKKRIIRITELLSTSGSREYVHIETINAWRMNEPFSVIVNSLITLRGKKGDYLVKDSNGNVYPVPAEQFRKNYKPLHFDWSEENAV